MTLLSQRDFPLISEENRIYTSRDRHIATLPDENLALEVAKRLNRDAQYVSIERLNEVSQ